MKLTIVGSTGDPKASNNQKSFNSKDLCKYDEFEEDLNADNVDMDPSEEDKLIETKLNWQMAVHQY